MVTRSTRVLCTDIPAKLLQGQVENLSHAVGLQPEGFIAGMLRVALATDAAQLVDAVFSVREGPSPGVAALGDFDDATAARIQQLFNQLTDTVESLHHVSYPQAERDAAVLGEHLQDRFSASDLSHALFTGIPRGGLIVLGMLAIAMDLDHQQLAPDPIDPDRLEIIVDDSAFTGLQIRRSVERSRSRRIGVGLLYAPAPLCAAVERQESRVHACVAARNLVDRGPEFYGEHYKKWVADWHERVSDQRYWIGQPDVVSFAWKEPDRSYINRVTGRWEAGWRTVPGELCLDNRGRRLHRDLQVQRAGVGPLVPDHHVFFADVDGRTVIADPRREHVMHLDHVGTAMWQALLDHGSREGMLSALLQQFEVDEAELSRDLDAFIAELERSGLVHDAVS